VWFAKNQYGIKITAITTAELETAFVVPHWLRRLDSLPSIDEHRSWHWCCAIFGSTLVCTIYSNYIFKFSRGAQAWHPTSATHSPTPTWWSWSAKLPLGTQHHTLSTPGSHAD
jgi:hypothetical protein